MVIRLSDGQIRLKAGGRHDPLTVLLKLKISMGSTAALELKLYIIYKKGMSIDGRDYLRGRHLEQILWITHGFGTKYWNESDFERDPDLARFERLSLKQTHSDRVRFIRAIPEGSLEGDAMITALPEILLLIKTADCLPVFIVDVKNHSIGAVHCGWAGTKKRICQKTVKAMISSFGSDPESMRVAMGPCIASSCYEVGEDVFSEFVQAGLPPSVFQRHPERENKYFLDLIKANRLQLAELGVREANIDSIDLCTHCDNSLVSYRRNRRTTQRLVNFIGLLW